MDRNDGQRGCEPNATKKTGYEHGTLLRLLSGRFGSARLANFLGNEKHEVSVARLVAGFATSHTPILALVADEWEARAVNDRKNPQLWDTAGVPRSYPNSRSSSATASRRSRCRPLWNEQYAKGPARSRPARCRARNGRARRADPSSATTNKSSSVWRTFGRVHFLRRNAATMKKMTLSPDPEFAWRKTVSVGYGMDKNYQHAAAPELARELIDRLMDDGFDIGAAASVPDPETQGFGHAYGSSSRV